MRSLPTREPPIKALLMQALLTKEQLMQVLAEQARLEQERIARFDQHKLSPQERKALHWWARGTKLKDLGAKIGTSKETAITHITNIKIKTGIRSKYGLMKLWWGSLPDYVAPAFSSRQRMEANCVRKKWRCCTGPLEDSPRRLLR